MNITLTISKNDHFSFFYRYIYEYIDLYKYLYKGKNNKYINIIL
jgi:hypothetical protein